MLNTAGLNNKIEKGHLELRFINFIDKTSPSSSPALFLLLDKGNAFFIDVDQFKGWLSIGDYVIIRNRQFEVDDCQKIIDDGYGKLTFKGDK